jgi:hypothetical protein
VGYLGGRKTKKRQQFNRQAHQFFFMSFLRMKKEKKRKEKKRFGKSFESLIKSLSPSSFDRCFIFHLYRMMINKACHLETINF